MEVMFYIKVVFLQKLFYSYNKAELYSKSNVFMHKIIENISKDKLKMNFLPKRPYYNKFILHLHCLFKSFI